ncbi:hypothetical protein DWU98_06585 [Dyella monticola]|uniref:Uncharacterized protein n=1 Tax=Dyella monticola TaxID=1927958 RepID=A0A370X394_9GAMM|nr:hypothetical protein [Dyella monticola]RDS82812.1 hypothetical protein DWU98_06585 [Dyella monticola]
MCLTDKDIELQLGDLARTVPQLLKDNQGAEFWIQFLDLANAIRDRVSLDRYDWVTERIYEILSRYGISPPSRWILAAATWAI